jgi:hypothetical protein
MSTRELDFHLFASVGHTWACYDEQWEFELPGDGGLGRMRTGVRPDWRGWQFLDSKTSAALRLLCESAYANPPTNDRHRQLFSDCSAMKLVLTKPGGGEPMEDMVVLAGRTDATAAPLLRLVDLVRFHDWPDRAPAVNRGWGADQD